MKIEFLKPTTRLVIPNGYFSIETTQEGIIEIKSNQLLIAKFNSRNGKLSLTNNSELPEHINFSQELKSLN